ncbi:hypothetical protein ACFLRA_03340 [Bdellovibrionota bacterium]
MRSIAAILILIFSSPLFAATLSKEDLRLHATRNPNAMSPRLELAKIFIQEGDLTSAHRYLREILEHNPANTEAQRILKKILLSDVPLLENDSKSLFQTKFFLIPHIPKNQGFVRQIKIDEFAERWTKLTGKRLNRDQTAILLYDSKESYLLASRGKGGYFIKTSPFSVSLDPRLSRDSITKTLREALVSLWLKQAFPNANIPPGLKAGLIGALSPFKEKPKPPLMIPVISLLEAPARSELRKKGVTAFILMLHELNPKAFAAWLDSWTSSKTPVQELLPLYKFKNWQEVHITFHDYLKS